jgi:hypothetical protein
VQLKLDLLTVYFASGFGDCHSNGIEYGRPAIASESTLDNGTTSSTVVAPHCRYQLYLDRGADFLIVPPKNYIYYSNMTINIDGNDLRRPTPYDTPRILHMLAGGRVSRTGSALW